MYSDIPRDDEPRALVHHPYSLSLETIIGTSRLLGHHLESCTLTRRMQDHSLLHALSFGSALTLRNKAQQRLFAVAPLDILVTGHGDGRQFHFIELNGTGIGGLTNMSHHAVGAVMTSMEETSALIDKPNPLIIIGSSGREAEGEPRLNKQIYEKLLYADAIRTGYMRRYGKALVTTMADVLAQPELLERQEPTVIVGYIKEFLAALTCRNGRLWLRQRQVDGLINDRMCLNLLHQFHYEVDLAELVVLNRTYLAGADKGVAYGLLNAYLSAHPHPFFPRQVYFEQAASRDDLIAAVLRQLRAGRKVVIKPRGTGLGHGIEFFLDPQEAESVIVARIDGSLQQTEQFYGLPGGALPYTLCEYIDTCVIAKQDHRLHHHKYELRVVVYRDGMELKAFPSIVKVSSQAFDPDHINRMMLINNITASAVTTKRSGSSFKLPLCNWETLDLLELRREHLQAVCAMATGYVRSLLDRIQDRPTDLGLPPSDAYSERSGRLSGEAHHPSLCNVFA